jgi:hypothetical protein
LRRGGYRHLAAEGGLYAFARELEGDRVVVAVNAGAAEARVVLEVAAGDGAVHCWGRGEAVPEGGSLSVRLPGRSAGVWLRG